jgi:hypothetical protein
MNNRPRYFCAGAFSFPTILTTITGMVVIYIYINKKNFRRNIYYPIDRNGYVTKLYQRLCFPDTG